MAQYKTGNANARKVRVNCHFYTPAKVPPLYKPPAGSGVLSRNITQPMEQLRIIHKVIIKRRVFE